MEQHFLLETALKQLKLPSFLKHYQSLAVDAATTNLTYERYLLALAQGELAQREAQRLKRAIAQARLPVLKELADFDFSAVSELSKFKVLDLAQGGYIERAENILLVGNPGLGKSHVATGLALAACRQKRRVRFYNVTGLINELTLAHQEHRLSRFISQALKLNLVILDEFGFIPYTPTGAQLLFQFCSALHERVAVIITTNLRFAEWNRVLNDETMTAALLDRLTFKSHILEFVGESWRFRQRMNQESLSGASLTVASEEKEKEKAS